MHLFKSSLSNDTFSLNTVCKCFSIELRTDDTTTITDPLYFWIFHDQLEQDFALQSQAPLRLKVLAKGIGGPICWSSIKASLFVKIVLGQLRFLRDWTNNNGSYLKVHDTSWANARVNLHSQVYFGSKKVFDEKKFHFKKNWGTKKIDFIQIALTCLDQSWLDLTCPTCPD